MENNYPKDNESITSNSHIENTKKNVFLLYRDNPSFQKFIPIIKTLIIAQGGTITEHLFPAGTPEKDIEEYLKSHPTLSTNYNVLTDSTTRNIQLHLGSPSNHGHRAGFLDNSISCATGFAIKEYYKFGEKKLSGGEAYERGESEEAKQKYLEELGTMYISILSKLPQEMKEKEYIIITSVSSSKPAWTYNTLIDHEYFREKAREPYMVDEKRLRRETNEYAQYMAQWFNQAGIKNTIIVPIPADLTSEQWDALRNDKAVIVWNRHNNPPKITKGMSEHDISEAKEFWGEHIEDCPLLKQRSLQTPIETFLCDLESKFHISTVPESYLQKELTDLIRDELDI